MPYKITKNCIYKKDTGEKVGCTKGDVRAYMRALLANTHENEDKIKGGLADKLTPQDIADKFGIGIEKINQQLSKGIEVESEHTDNKSMAREIALDHLSEFPDYYTRLEKMEFQAIKSVIKEVFSTNLLNENEDDDKSIYDAFPMFPKKALVILNDIATRGKNSIYFKMFERKSNEFKELFKSFPKVSDRYNYELDVNNMSYDIQKLCARVVKQTSMDNQRELSNYLKKLSLHMNDRNSHSGLFFPDQETGKALGVGRVMIHDVYIKWRGNHTFVSDQDYINVSLSIYYDVELKQVGIFINKIFMKIPPYFLSNEEKQRLNIQKRVIDLYSELKFETESDKRLFTFGNKYDAGDKSAPVIGINYIKSLVTRFEKLNRSLQDLYEKNRPIPAPVIKKEK